MSQFSLSEIQSKAILDLRLQKLTGLERDKIKEEYAELMKIIEYYRDILANENLRMEIIKDSYQDFGAGQFIWRAGDPKVEGYVAASDARRDGQAVGF